MASETIKSARRVFEVLEYFDRVRAPLSLKDVCERFRYPPSSGSGILKSLVRLGYLEYDKRSRTYLPTMRIAVLGSWVVTDLFGDLNIIRLMEDLRDATRETVVLAAQSDLHAQYVHVSHSRQPLQYAVAPGTLRPLARSGFGRLLLSADPDPVIQATVRRLDAARGPHEAKIGLPELMADIHAIRQQGFTVSHNLVTPGVGIIGVLLPKTHFGRVFAIGLGGFSDGIESGRERHLDLLRAAADTFAGTLTRPAASDRAVTRSLDARRSA